MMDPDAIGEPERDEPSRARFDGQVPIGSQY